MPTGSVLNLLCRGAVKWMETWGHLDRDRALRIAMPDTQKLVLGF